jgi:hypothetical protein
MNISFDIANLISFAAGLILLTACALLWVRSKTTWALLALAGQAVSVLCRLLLFVPDVFAQFPLVRLVWPLGALVFAIGLAGYAWTEYEASRRVVKP